MKPHLTTPILIPALALLLLAAAFVGYQAVSAQTTQEELGDDPPPAPTGLTATHDGVGVLLEWDDPDDGSIVGYRVWRRYHRDSHEGAERDPVDDELQLHVAHTGSSENHFHDSDFVEHETVYGYAVSAIGSDGSEGYVSEEATITTPDAPGEAPDEIEGVSLEVVEGDVRITWSSLNDDTITDFHISRTSEDHVEGGNWIHLTNSAPLDGRVPRLPWVVGRQDLRLHHQRAERARRGPALRSGAHNRRRQTVAGRDADTRGRRSVCADRRGRGGESR